MITNLVGICKRLDELLLSLKIERRDRRLTAVDILLLAAVDFLLLAALDFLP